MRMQMQTLAERLPFVTPVPTAETALAPLVVVPPGISGRWTDGVAPGGSLVTVSLRCGPCGGLDVEACERGRPAVVVSGAVPALERVPDFRRPRRPIDRFGREVGPLAAAAGALVADDVVDAEAGFLPIPPGWAPLVHVAAVRLTDHVAILFYVEIRDGRVTDERLRYLRAHASGRIVVDQMLQPA
jgi:hypothetical protein